MALAVQARLGIKSVSIQPQHFYLLLSCAPPLVSSQTKPQQYLPSSAQVQASHKNTIDKAILVIFQYAYDHHLVSTSIVLCWDCFG